MFPPDADITPYETSGSAAANRARGEPKVIKHGNTRLQQEESTDSHSISAPPSPTRSRIDAAIAGTPCKLDQLSAFSYSVLTKLFTRPPKITNNKQLLSGSHYAIPNPLGARSSSSKTTHDLGNSERHPTHTLSI